MGFDDASSQSDSTWRRYIADQQVKLALVTALCLDTSRRSSPRTCSSVRTGLAQPLRAFLGVHRVHGERPLREPRRKRDRVHDRHRAEARSPCSPFYVPPLVVHASSNRGTASSG